MYHCKILIPACLFFSLSVAAQTSSPDKAPAKKAAPAAKAPASAKAAPFDPALLRPATLTAKAPDVYEVKFVTTAGDFSVKVTRAWAPNGADRFYNLVRHHFYDGVAFFRVLPGFMAQKAAGAVKDRDMNCIMLFLVGGPSHIDTWDPKPKAPAEVRGPFQPIATNAPPPILQS